MKQIAEWAVLGMAVVAACTAMGDMTLSENVVLDADAETLQVLGSKGPTTDSFENQDNAALLICVPASHNDKFGRYKIHSFKVWHQDAMRFDFVPARNPASGAVGLLNRLDGTLHPSGTATGTLGTGVLRVEAASEAALGGLTGTVDANVRMSLDGNCGLSFPATGPSMA